MRARKTEANDKAIHSQALRPLVFESNNWNSVYKITPLPTLIFTVKICRVLTTERNFLSRRVQPEERESPQS